MAKLGEGLKAILGRDQDQSKLAQKFIPIPELKWYVECNVHKDHECTEFSKLRFDISIKGKNYDPLVTNSGGRYYEIMDWHDPEINIIEGEIDPSREEQIKNYMNGLIESSLRRSKKLDKALLEYHHIDTSKRGIILNLNRENKWVLPTDPRINCFDNLDYAQNPGSPPFVEMFVHLRPTDSVMLNNVEEQLAKMEGPA